MQVETWNINKIIPYERNPRNNNEAVAKVAMSLEQYGWQQPIVVDVNGVIVAGHTRYKAAQKLNYTECPVVVAKDLSPEKIKAYRIADNKTGEIATWDMDLLNIEIKELMDLDFDIELTGFELEDFNFDDDEETGEGKDADVIPEVDEEIEPIAKTGDIWLLGKHRVMCGDSTNADDVARLMDGEKAELLFTSPPYSDMRKYSGNDVSVVTLKKFIPVWSDFVNFQVVNLGLQKKDGEIFEYWQEYIQEAKQCGYKLLAWNVWDKTMSGSIASQTAMFTMTHEWIFVFGEQVKKLNRTIPNNMENYKQRHGELILKKGFYTKTREYDGSISMSKVKAYTHHQLHSVIQCYPELSNIRKEHPATFPVAFPISYIEAMTNENDIVCEPFTGSGTTLIACEKTKRICYGMEISTKYVDVIIKRYEQFTGKKAVRESENE